MLGMEQDATKIALMDGLKEAYKDNYSTRHPLTTIKGDKLVEWDKATCSLAAQIPTLWTPHGQARKSDDGCVQGAHLRYERRGEVS